MRIDKDLKSTSYKNQVYWIKYENFWTFYVCFENVEKMIAVGSQQALSILLQTSNDLQNDSRLYEPETRNPANFRLSVVFAIWYSVFVLFFPLFSTYLAGTASGLIQNDIQDMMTIRQVGT